jgi:hypothetical protein
MKAKLIRVLREEDNNGFTEILAKYFKDTELLIDPQREMRIQIDNISFFIDRIEQDLNTQLICLYEYKDIFYRYNRDNEGFIKEKEILLKDGWKLYN